MSWSAAASKGRARNININKCTSRQQSNMATKSTMQTAQPQERDDQAETTLSERPAKKKARLQIGDNREGVVGELDGVNKTLRLILEKLTESTAPGITLEALKEGVKESNEALGVVLDRAQQPTPTPLLTRTVTAGDEDVVSNKTKSVWKETRRGRVAVLTFKCPPDNLLKRKSLTELMKHLERLAERDDVSVVMLTSAIEGYFVKHACLDELEKIANGVPVEGDKDAWKKVTSLLGTMPQPTVAAIDGQAHGGGLEICLACTMRIASERSHMALPEATMGLIPGAGGTQRLPRLVGEGIAAELCITGRKVYPDEALRIGLINAKFPAVDFIDKATDWCQKVAMNPDISIRAAKKAVHGGMTMPLEEALLHERELFRELMKERFTKPTNE